MTSILFFFKLQKKKNPAVEGKEKTSESGLTFSLGMVLDMSAGLIMAGTPPRKDTAVLTSLKLFFSFSSSTLNSTDGESGPVQKT